MSFSKTDESYRKEKSAMAVVLCGGKILATRETIYGHEALSLPKGHIETGETHIDAAVRECLEETGVLLCKSEFVREITPFTVRFTDHNAIPTEKMIYPVVFRINEEKPTDITEAGIHFAGFMNTADFIAKCSYENVKNVVYEALSEGLQ